MDRKPKQQNTFSIELFFVQWLKHWSSVKWATANDFIPQLEKNQLINV